MPEDAPLLATRGSGVLTLALNRPQSLNALTPDVLIALAQALTYAASDPEVGAVVLTGAGRAFCSGQDLRALTRDTNVLSELETHYLPVIRALYNLPKPVVAAVNGVAAGAGVSLALACDFRVVAASAQFSLAFVGVGLVPDAGASYFLPRIVGSARAAEMMMLGEPVDSGAAVRMGLVSRVFPDDVLLAAAQELAARLASGPYSMQLIKRLLHSTWEKDLVAQFAQEGAAQAQAAQSADFREGLAAFLEKRAPRFSGH